MDKTLRQTLTLLAIIGLIFCSFYYEQVAYQHIIGRLIDSDVIRLSYIVAFAFNAAKFILAWDISKHWASGRRLLIKQYSAFGLLVLNSIICSQMVVSAQLDAPNMEQAVFAKKAELKEQFALEDKLLKQRHTLQLNTVREEYQQKRIFAMEMHQPIIDKFQKAMDVEKQHTFEDGTFVGPRYLEAERKRDDEKNLLDDKVARLNGQENATLSRLRDRFDQQLETNADAQLAAFGELKKENLKQSGSYLIEDEMVSGLIRIVNGALGMAVSSVQLIFVLGLLMSLIIELVSFAMIASLYEGQAQEYGVMASHQASNNISPFPAKNSTNAAASENNAPKNNNLTSDVVT